MTDDSSASSFGDERLAAHRWAADLAGLSFAERLRRVREDRVFASPSFIELSIGLGRDLGLSPTERQRWAELAVEAALRGRCQRAGELEPLAWAVLGTVHRVRGRLTAGRIAFIRCRAARHRITDPLEVADTLSLEAAFLTELAHWSSRREWTGEPGTRARGSMASAADLLDEALRLALLHATECIIGRYETQVGLLAQKTGRWSVAATMLLSAVERIDPARYPRLALVAGHNLAATAIGLGQHDAAMDGIVRLEHQYQLVHDPVVEPKILLVRDHRVARTAHARGQLQDAEDQFCTLRERFLNHGLYLEAADIDFSIAQVAVEAGRWSTAEHLVARALRVLSASGATVTPRRSRWSQGT